MGRSTDEHFEGILSKIKRLVNGWVPQFLNTAGREVLIKAICQAIPTYSMSCFRLSRKFCKKINSVIARFFWGGDEKKQKMHWRKWRDVSIPKCEGGLGFRDMEQFNQAMLVKQGWRLLYNPSSLCARVFKGKYFHSSDFMSAQKRRGSSLTWRAILHGREALKLGLIKRVGVVVSINAWTDPWIPENYGIRTMVKKSDTNITMVKELMIP